MRGIETLAVHLARGAANEELLVLRLNAASPSEPASSAKGREAGAMPDASGAMASSASPATMAPSDSICA